MSKVTWTLLAAFVLTLAVTSASASGIAREDEGPAGAAMAGAFTARADDPSAVYYNPAGILQLDGTRLMVGGSGSLRSITLDQNPHSNPSMDENFFWSPSVYLTHRFSERFGFGFGVYDPFAQQVEWKRDFPGRFITRDSRLRVTAFNPVIAFGIKNWSFAAGGSLLRGDATFTRNLDFSAIPADQGLEKITGDTTDFAPNVGIRWAGKKIQIGVTYRGSSTLQFDDADVSFTNVPGSANVALCGGATCYPTQQAKFEIEVPAEITGGVAFGIKNWKLEVDVTHTEWNGAFDQIDINYERNSIVLPDQALVLNWDSAWTYRLGAALPVGTGYELRAGFSWDTDPVPDETVNPIFPESEKYSFQAGYGYAAPSGKFRYDAYARWTDGNHQPQTTPPVGTYDGNEIAVGLAGTWTF